MAKKRGNGEGSIRQTKEGYWEARIMIGYNEKGKPKYKVFSSKTRSEVSKKLSDYIAGKKVLTTEVVSQDTVAQWLNNCFVINRITLTGGTYTLEVKDSYGVYIVTDGNGIIYGNDYRKNIKKGDYFFLPHSAMGKLSVAGDIQLVECY